MQEAYQSILDKNIPKVGLSVPSRPPSGVIVGNDEALSWTDGSGNIRVSNYRGSYIVGRSCNFKNENNNLSVAVGVKSYMQMYDVKHWKEAQELCTKAGVVTISESISSPAKGNKPAELVH